VQSPVAVYSVEAAIRFTKETTQRTGRLRGKRFTLKHGMALCVGTIEAKTELSEVANLAITVMPTTFSPFIRRRHSARDALSVT
jgi:hypothetical protein